jgi:hypothetical protein
LVELVKALGEFAWQRAIPFKMVHRQIRWEAGCSCRFTHVMMAERRRQVIPKQTGLALIATHNIARQTKTMRKLIPDRIVLGNRFQAALWANPIDEMPHYEIESVILQSADKVRESFGEKYKFIEIDQEYPSVGWKLSHYGKVPFVKLITVILAIKV